MSRDPKDWGVNPLTGKQRRISTLVSLGVAILVMWRTENLLWGFVTFLVLGVFVNALIFMRHRRD